MSIVLGIDIGGSTTKIVGLRSDGSAIAMHRVQAQDPITSLYGAMGNFLFCVPLIEKITIPNAFGMKKKEQV